MKWWTCLTKEKLKLEDEVEKTLLWYELVLADGSTNSSSMIPLSDDYAKRGILFLSYKFLNYSKKCLVYKVNQAKLAKFA